MNVERWAPVVGLEGLYEVSNYGRVRSLAFRNGTANIPRIKIIRPHRARNGYLQIRLAGRPAMKLQRLVLEAFVGRREPHQQAAHLDGDKENNHLGNLAWVTRSENEAHKTLHGTQIYGTKNHNAKLKEEDAREIRRLYGVAPSSLLAEQFRCSVDNIRLIGQGKAWRHLATPPAPTEPAP